MRTLALLLVIEVGAVPIADLATHDRAKLFEQTDSHDDMAALLAEELRAHPEELDARRLQPGAPPAAPAVCGASTLGPCTEAECTTDLDAAAKWSGSACVKHTAVDLASVAKLHELLGLSSEDPSDICKFPMVVCAGTYSLTVPPAGAKGAAFDQAFGEPMPNLAGISAAGAGFTGVLPEALAGSTLMTNFDISANKIGGPLLDSYSAWTELSVFNIAQQAPPGGFTGTLPPSYASWTKLVRFIIYLNPRLGGTLPKEYGAWTNCMFFMVVVNGVVGPIPKEYAAMTRMMIFYYASNKGPGPINDTPLKELATWTMIRDFRMTTVNYEGTLPPELAAWTGIGTFLISRNPKLVGTLPPEYSAWTNVGMVSVGDSSIVGTLPAEYAAWTSLTYLNVAGPGSDSRVTSERDGTAVRITGTLPPEYAAWTDLRTLQCNNQELSGTIPAEYNAWKGVGEFLASNNKLTGQLPALQFSGGSGGVFTLSDNLFTGTLPAMNVERLDVSNNQIVDADVTSSTTLSLDLSGNALTQLPPAWVTGVLHLQRLDLSRNQIAGWTRAGVRFSKACATTACERCDLAMGADNDMRQARMKIPYDAPPLQWAALRFLRADSNPIGTGMWGYPGAETDVHGAPCDPSCESNVPVRDFLASLASLTMLQDLTCVDCDLTGEIRMEANMFVPAQKADCTPGEGFASLTSLDLSGNAITSITAPRPAGLRIVTLARTGLTKLAPESGADFFAATYLDVRECDGLTRPMTPASTDAPCTAAETDLRADPVRFVASTDDEPECTSICPLAESVLLVSPTMDTEALCRCAPGFGGSGTACEECPADTYSTRPYMNMTAVCQSCPAFASTAGVTKSSVASACVCDTASKTIKYEDGSCGCVEGDYMDHDAGECKTCYDGLNCSWTRIALGAEGRTTGVESLLAPVVMPGYMTDFGGSVWKCKGDEICLGGNADLREGACATNREGIACGRCKAQHREDKRFGPCSLCEDVSYGLGVLVVLALWGALVLLFLWCFRRAARADAERVSGFMSSPIPGAMKILARYMVKVAVIADFNVPWPEINKVLFAWARFMRLDPLEFVFMGCLTQAGDSQAEMWARWLTPVVVSVALFAGWLLSKAISRGAQTISSPVLLRFLGIGYSVLFGSIVKICLIPFECTPNPNGRNNLASMPYVECYEGDHWGLVGVGAVFICAYVLSFLVFQIYVAWKVKKQDDVVATRYSFVFGDFRAKMFFWGPVILIKEVLFAGSVAFFPGSGSAQLIFVAFVMFTYVVLASHFRPFPMHEQNQLDIICDSGLLLQLVFSLTFELELSQGQRDTASSGLVVLQICSIATPFVIFGIIALKGRKKMIDTQAMRELLQKLAKLHAADPGRLWGTLSGAIKAQTEIKMDDVELDSAREVVSFLAAGTRDPRIIEIAGVQGRAMRLGGAVKVRPADLSRVSVNADLEEQDTKPGIVDV